MSTKTKYFERFNPDSGKLYSKNSEIGSGVALKKAFFQVSTNASISFVTTGGDTVSSLSVLAGVQYDIEVTKITACDQTVYIRHNGEILTNQIETAPGTQALSITFANVATTSLDVNFTNGSGIKRILVCRSGGAVNASPVDGTTYTGSTVFGSGSQIGTGNYVIAVRDTFDTSAITVTGLTTGTTYHFRVFEYRGSVGNEKYNTATSTNNPRSQATS